MSYIHDALKASAEQRKRAQDVPSPPLGGGGVPARSVGWVGWLGRALLMVLLALLLFWGWRIYDRPPPAEIEPPLAVERVSMPTPSPAGDAPDLSGVKISIRETPEVSPGVSPSTPATATKDEQAEVADAVDAQVEVATEDPYASIPYLRQLPVELQRELQNIRFSVHIYAAEPSSRLVKYEGKMLREGDFVRPGLRIEAIVPRAVVLQYRQTRFKVPAL